MDKKRIKSRNVYSLNIYPYTNWHCILMSKLLRCSSISDLVMYLLQCTPFIQNFSALHFTHSYTTLEGVPKFYISTHPRDKTDFH